MEVQAIEFQKKLQELVALARTKKNILEYKADLTHKFVLRHIPYIHASNSNFPVRHIPKT